MSTAWGRGVTEDWMAYEEALPAPLCQPCRNCGSFTDAGETLCPSCQRHEQIEAR